MPKQCPVTRKHFLEHAKPVKIEIDGNSMLAEIKEFSTGSFGWYLTGKTIVDIGGTPCNVQIGMNLTVVGSKEAKPE